MSETIVVAICVTVGLVAAAIGLWWATTWSDPTLGIVVIGASLLMVGSALWWLRLFRRIQRRGGSQEGRTTR